MYLRSIHLRNAGLIQELNWNLPFAGDQPTSLVLLSRDASVKSTLISFIVYALVDLRQRVYEDVEIEKGKVNRIDD